ncbi:MAG TPA: BamA/TamA family outer membrane protein [Steroidobacteraceae bacterium]|nr:BamA/TamA family outer membrane protein [Steroidobacteraceae bacterium]
MPIDMGVRGQHSRFPQEDFFGLGRFGRREDRTDYLLESTKAGAGLQWEPAKPMRLAVRLSYVSPSIGSGTDSRFLSTPEVFDPAELPGFEAQPDFLRSDASLVLDWRDQPQHPHAGGQVGLQVSHSRDQDLDAFSFHRLAIDVQHYVPLPDRYRTVALRASALLTAPQSGQQVPFYYQPTLGGSQALRGFREFRFQDRNSLLLTAEYRWEASWLLDGALFVDAGKVALDRRDLTFRDLEVSYGLGFRVHSNSAFVARLDLAFSREGFIPLLRFEHVF